MTDKLITLAKSVREHLQTKTPSSLPCIPFNEFPKGCCSDSSLVLAELINRRFGSVAKVLSFDKGQNGVSDSHAWVEVGSLCIDITLDQFNSESEVCFPAIHAGSRYPIHNEYKNGEQHDTSPPSWLESVVDELDELISK